jgi:hypothetical protein
LTVGIFAAEKTARPLLMEKQNADELIMRDLAFRCALFEFFTAFSLFLVFNKIQCCESGSGRIDIILADPDLNPY